MKAARNVGPAAMSIIYSYTRQGKEERSNVKILQYLKERLTTWLMMQRGRIYATVIFAATQTL
jgi:hypothetical protein